MPLIDDLVREAETLENAGRNRQAIEQWRAAVAKERRPEFLARLGRLCTFEGLLDEGEAILLEAIREAPDFPDSYFYLGFNYKDRDRLEEAKQTLENGLRLEPWASAHVVLGEVYRRLHENEQAREQFRLATELDPSNGEGWYGLGLTFKFVEDQKAIQYLRRALKADPDLAAAHRELGHMLWRQGSMAEAEASIRLALSINNDDSWAHHYLGELLLLRDQPTAAETELRRATELWPEQSLFHCSLGDALAQQNRMTDAERAYRHALSLDTSNALANLRYGQLLKERGEVKKAIVYLKRARDARPTDRRAKKALEDLGIR